MKRQHIVLLAVIVIVLASLTVLAVHKYKDTPKGLSLSQAVSQRNSALEGLQAEKAIDANDQKAASTTQAGLQGQVTTLTSQKATLCAQITKYKLIQPLCQ